jgi:flagellar hook assembly protein FlgD
VDIYIYDILGREVSKFNLGLKSTGIHSVQWNGLDYQGNPVGAGIYLFQIQAGYFTQTKKMVLMK